MKNVVFLVALCLFASLERYKISQFALTVLLKRSTPFNHQTCAASRHVTSYLLHTPPPSSIRQAVVEVFYGLPIVNDAGTGGVGILSYQEHDVNQPAFFVGMGFPLAELFRQDHVCTSTVGSVHKYNVV